MKKLMLALITTGSLAAFSHSAFAQKSNVDNDKPPMCQEHEMKDLNLSAEQAKLIVQAKLIQHGRENARIQKVETINLNNNKHFYLIYINEKSATAPDAFMIVDAQSGFAMPFPKPPHPRMPMPPMHHPDMG